MAESCEHGNELNVLRTAKNFLMSATTVIS